MNVNSVTDDLFPTLLRLAYLRQDATDHVALSDAVLRATSRSGLADDLHTLSEISRLMEFGKVRAVKAPDLSAVPLLVHLSGSGWALLRGRNATGQWVLECFDIQTSEWKEKILDDAKEMRCFIFSTRRPGDPIKSQIRRTIAKGLLRNKPALWEMLVGSITVNLLAIATAFYSMQVYDRVVPTGASATLLVLSIGACLAILLELLIKQVRSATSSGLVAEVDALLAQIVYARFLSLRMDQLPQSVGSLASQLRGYESVRGLLASSAAQLLTDFPFALIFAFFIFLIGGKLVLIPLAFLVMAVVLGVISSRESLRLARVSYRAANEKTGLLVETVEGAETIKSGQGGWRMLSRWLQVTAEVRDSDLAMKKSTESFQYVAGAIHQLCYVLTIAAGALVVGQGGITLGSLIAVSILSGRLLSSIAAIPGFVNQLSQTLVALQGLDKLWAMRDDHDGVSKPVVLDGVQGSYRLESVDFSYNGKPALRVPALRIACGEKVGIVGPIGAGKTSLLRLLSGMYKPQKGTVHLDDVDISHISKPVLAANVAFVAQDARLFAGTLKENLILGIIDPGDRVINEMARKTGLYDLVIATHPKGLYQEIFEGGTGLSGGQRQLVHFTRAFLRNPSVWLLDEPTASMDSSLEKRSADALRNAVASSHTVVLVTHKPDLIAFVDRLIVVAGNQIMLDGPRDMVLAELQNQLQNRKQECLATS
jgi:ATP-binding cassette subfamily C protein LapB